MPAGRARATCAQTRADAGAPTRAAASAPTRAAACPPTRAAARALVLAAVCALTLAACSGGPTANLAEGPAGSGGVASPLAPDASGSRPPSHDPPGASRPPSSAASGSAVPGSAAPGSAAPGSAAPGSLPARPQGTLARRIHLSVPDLGLRRLRVVPYRGTADDRPGTRIQDRGLAATPRGPRGGVGPGQVGNFVVTGHRTTHGRPFGDLPSVRRGAHVLVMAGGLVYDYRITRTLRVSFRDRGSRMSQSAPVPGRPGVPADDAWITLSTCATPEDHAAGNYWSDALGNPEHRIDKVGRLVDVRPAR